MPPQEYQRRSAGLHPRSEPLQTAGTECVVRTPRKADGDSMHARRLHFDAGIPRLGLLNLFAVGITTPREKAADPGPARRPLGRISVQGTGSVAS